MVQNIVIYHLKTLGHEMLGNILQTNFNSSRTSKYVQENHWEKPIERNQTIPQSVLMLYVCMYVCMNEWIRLDMNNSSHLWGCWHLQVGCYVHVGCHGDNASVVNVWFQACDDCSAWVCRDGLGFSSFTVVRDQETVWSLIGSTGQTPVEITRCSSHWVYRQVLRSWNTYYTKHRTRKFK